MNRSLLAALAAVALSARPAPAAFVPFDNPGGGETVLRGISGSRVVGTSYDPSAGVNRGFVYDRVTGQYTPLAPPGAASTFVTGVSGNAVVGYYEADPAGFAPTGFVYDLASGTHTAVTSPGRVVWLQGVSGAAALAELGEEVGPGSYQVTYALYDLTTGAFTPYTFPPGLDLPAAAALDGTTLVGYAADFATFTGLGFVYDLAAGDVTRLGIPGSPDTGATGVSGGVVVGRYYTSGYAHSRGFAYDQATGEYSVLRAPGGGDIFGLSIDGTAVAGSYFDPTTFTARGFFADLSDFRPLAAVPEPASAALAGAAAAGVLGARLRRRTWAGA